MKKNSRRIVVVTLLSQVCLLGAAVPNLAHGDEMHHKDQQMSSHMQAMYVLKDRIPKEYSLMERTPVVPDTASLTRGEELYHLQCSVCHGKEGRGGGPAAKSLKTPPADFLDLEHSQIYGPGEKYWIIGNGTGETGMPAFQQIDLIDRWHVVNYIYDLQKRADAKLQDM